MDYKDNLEIFIKQLASLIILYIDDDRTCFLEKYKDETLQEVIMRLHDIGYYIAYMHEMEKKSVKFSEQDDDTSNSTHLSRVK